MKITDELRKWAHGPDEGDDWLDRIDEFCDRIDAAHRSALEKLAAQVDESERSGFDQGFASADDWFAQNEDVMAEHGWVRLPLDADGVLIRIGDEVTDGEESFVVNNITFYGDGSCSIRNYCDDAWSACDIRHYHAPTVEDVLREFAEKITDSQVPGVHPTYEEAIAEFAAKLRLAGDAE